MMFLMNFPHCCLVEPERVNKIQSLADFFTRETLKIFFIRLLEQTTKVASICSSEVNGFSMLGSVNQILFFLFNSNPNSSLEIDNSGSHLKTIYTPLNKSGKENQLI